ncbi:DNA replication complex GINS family protein [Candidatus Pacearchaeota archaeon]|nr:DNA replication complex GINS family protein [Candidatus Pacearchaeota archaeon]
MITYNDIYECLRKERYSEQLQPLTKKFVNQVAEYIQEKKKLAGQGGDLFSDEILKTKKQLENAISIFKELMLVRKKKLLSLVFVASETGISKRDFENMLPFEKELFDNVMISIEQAEKVVSKEFANGNGVISEERELKLILFLEDMEKFVGLDGRDFGPYKKGDVVNISKKIADILIDSSKAELVVDD